MSDVVFRTGALFSLFAFFHFSVDFIFQSHKTAMAKSTDWKVRFDHCMEYACGVAILICLSTCELGFWSEQRSVFAGTCLVFWLFLTHFIEDTYYPVYLWLRYVRKAPLVVSNGISGMKEYAKEPLGIVLIIAVDQIVHLACLLPVAYLFAR